MRKLLIAKVMIKTLLNILLILLCQVSYGQMTVNKTTSEGAVTAILPQFNSVDINAPMKLKFVRVDSAKENRIEFDLKGVTDSRFEYSIKDSTLHISERASLRRTTTSEAIIYHSTPIRKVEVVRADIAFDSPLSSKLLDFKLHSEARLKCRVECEDMMLNISGRSTARVTGESRYLSISALSNSTAILRDVTTLSTWVDASYGATVEVHAGERLAVKSVVGAVVRYYGKPSIIRSGDSLIGGEILNMEDE